MKSHKVRYAVVSLIVGGALVATSALAQSNGKAMTAQATQGSRTTAQAQQGGMPACCKMMMERHQKMMGKCRQMDARLDELVAKVKAASGEQKIEAMAQLLEELVAQRKAMHGTMMQGQGMGHGTMGGKTRCPMTQQQSGGTTPSGK